MEHGTGYRVFPDGSNYFGDWKAGKMHGKGVLKIPAEGVKYDGFFVNGMKEGFGIEEK